jgi:hypothetical protein
MDTMRGRHFGCFWIDKLLKGLFFENLVPGILSTRGPLSSHSLLSPSLSLSRFFIRRNLVVQLKVGDRCRRVEVLSSPPHVWELSDRLIFLVNDDSMFGAENHLDGMDSEEG